jgi:hypothetical protein
MAADSFSRHGTSERSRIGVVFESEMNLRMTGIPHQCHCIVAGRLLLANESREDRPGFS